MVTALLWSSKVLVVGGGAGDVNDGDFIFYINIINNDAVGNTTLIIYHHHYYCRLFGPWPSRTLLVQKHPVTSQFLINGEEVFLHLLK